MVQVVLIGVGAGAATALLFASVASGSALSVPLFYLAPLPILIAAMGWSHWAALIAAVVASAEPRGRVRHVLLHRLPARHRAAGMVARLSRAAGAPGNRCRARRTRMVSGRPSGVLGRDHRRRHRDRRHADASAAISTASALRCAAASNACSSSRTARHRARMRRAPDTRSEPADRHSGGGAAAGRGGARHRHQRGQSLACRAHRENLGTAAPPAARPVGHAFPGLRAGADRRRGRGLVRCRASSASRPACSPRAC